MMMTGTLRGPAAELYWSYLPAATLGPWTMTATDAGYTVTAAVVTVDPFRSTQPRDLTFRVTRGDAPPWIWPVAHVSVGGGTLRATVLPET